MPKTAGIVLVGNEILSGKIQDANAAYLCRELRALGVDVRRIVVIPDEIDLIAREVGGNDVMAARLKELTTYINELGHPETRSLWYVDTGPFLERELAEAGEAS